MSEEQQQADNTEVEFLGHEECDDCGSSDARATYSDGHSFCFSCKTHVAGDKKECRHNDDLISGDYTTLPSRALRADTLRKFDYRVNADKALHAATYYNSAGKPIAQKIRRADKSFAWIGNPNASVLFGQQCWSGGGRKLVITEGEIDAMSMSQVQGNRWPCVSIKDGATSAVSSIRENLEFVSSFDEVILMFDSDEPGVEAAHQAAALLRPGTAFIAHLPLKDANEMLVAGRADELVNCLWRAKAWRPDGIVAGEDVWEKLQTEDVVTDAEYPFFEINDKLKGLRKGELVTIVAGTGCGKSTITKEIAHGLIKQGKRVGFVALEETVKHTARCLMSIELNQPLHLTPMDRTLPEYRAAFDATAGRVAFYDHFGSHESDSLLSKIRYMAVGLGCEYVVLDHLSIVVSGTDSNDNERVLLDKAMTNLASLAREVGIGLIVVCHLRKSGGVAFEEGGQVSLVDVRGSGGIAQLSDIVFAAERDQQSGVSNSVLLRVLKNRFSGFTGEAGTILYNEKTGRLQDEQLFEDTEDADAGVGALQQQETREDF
jgi:twinkle protein